MEEFHVCTFSATQNLSKPRQPDGYFDEMIEEKRFSLTPCDYIWLPSWEIISMLEEVAAGSSANLQMMSFKKDETAALDAEHQPTQ
jgi:hypothetical protein